MSRFFGTQICQWQVVTGRIIAAHQPPRAISSVPKAVQEDSEEQDNSHIFGQSDSHVIPQQGGGDSISFSKQADVGYSDILSGSWHFSDTKLSSGSGQSECGRSFQGSGIKGVAPESLGGQQDTHSHESAHLPVYFSIYRKDRRAEGSMLWF